MLEINSKHNGKTENILTVGNRIKDIFLDDVRIKPLF